jgi:hypothetical protein
MSGSAGVVRLMRWQKANAYVRRSRFVGDDWQEDGIALLPHQKSEAS